MTNQSGEYENYPPEANKDWIVEQSLMVLVVVSGIAGILGGFTLMPKPINLWV